MFKIVIAKDLGCRLNSRLQLTVKGKKCAARFKTCHMLYGAVTIMLFIILPIMSLTVIACSSTATHNAAY